MAASLECSSCHAMKDVADFTERQLNLGQFRRCPDCTRAAREAGEPSAGLEAPQPPPPPPPPPGPAWNVGATAPTGRSTTQAAATGFEIWLPTGTQCHDRRKWVARLPGSENMLPDRLPFTAPYHATKSCAKRGQWLQVHVTKGGTLQSMGILEGAAELNEAALPPHLRGDPPFAGAARTGESYAAVASHQTTPLDTKAVLVHVILDRSTAVQSVRIEQHGGPGNIQCQQVQPGYWVCIEPIPCDLVGFDYVVAVDTPGRFFGTNTSHSVRRMPGRTHHSPKLEHVVDLGEGEPEQIGKRIGFFLGHLVDTAMSVEALEALLRAARSYDLTGPINSLLKSRRSAVQLQMILIIISRAMITRIDRNVLIESLNASEPPSRLLPAFEATLPTLASYIAADDTTWIALLRWGLSQRSIQQLAPKPAADASHFTTSLVVFASWQTVSTFWSGADRAMDLLTLLAKLCSTVPNFECLRTLLEQSWKAGANSGTISEMLDKATKAKRPLKDAVDAAWVRCLKPFRLSHLVALHKAYPQYAHAICEAATDIRVWDGTFDEQAAALLQMNFTDEWARALSELVLKNITRTGRREWLNVFPRLLDLLASSGVQQAQLTESWVKAFIQAVKGRGTRDEVAAGVAELCHLIAHSWRTWSTPALADAQRALRVQVLNLHNRADLHGGPMLLNAARRLGEDAFFVSSAIFKEWLLPEAIRK